MNSTETAQAKNSTIILLVIFGLVFGLAVGAIGGILLQARSDKVKIIGKDNEIASLKDKFSGIVKMVETLKQKDAEIDSKDKTIQELQKKITDNLFTANISSEEFNAAIRKQFEQGDFSAVQRALESLPPIFLRDYIKMNTGFSYDDMPKDDSKLGEYGMRIFSLEQENQPKTVAAGQTVETISFALRVKEDNSPVSPQTVFRPGDRRIYACFQNQGALKGQSRVVHRWINTSIKETIKLETKPIDPNASDNFIWVEKKDGWPAGEYVVELLNTKGFLLIAQSTFTILAGENKEENKEEAKKDKSDKSETPKKGSKVLVEEQYVDTYKLVIEGGKISDAEAANLEKTLQKNQDDFTVRIKLLGYYSLKQFKSETAREARQKHVLWVIQNRPDSLVAGLPDANLDPIMDKDAYREAKTLWLKQVETYKDNTAVIGNAANFLFIHDKKKAEELLLKAQALEPKNPKWPKRLEFLRSLFKNKEQKSEPK